LLVILRVHCFQHALQDIIRQGRARYQPWISGPTGIGEFQELDFTEMKTFPVTESKRLEFRSEFFNLPNHPTFASPGTNINSSSGGQVSATLNTGRIIQLALKLRF